MDLKADILLGLQWGDEGKGKVVDVLTPDYDVIARFQGGPNAGHSLHFEGRKHVLHSIPSGIFHPGTLNIVGNGVVLDPVIFREEIEALEKFGLQPRENLVISKKAHLILPTHRLLDAAQEEAMGKSRIGSTLKGIGPAYTDKTARHGIRAGDILLPGFEEKYHTLRENHLKQLTLFGKTEDFSSLEKQWFEALEILKSFSLADSEYLVNNLLDTGKSLLAEGAQGTLLDIDFGSYPFVTSSNTVAAGALTGLGLAPSRIGKVYGIFKAYCTRVGSGPFPTEQNNRDGKFLQDRGHEYGATTGRPRRCGWLDLPALKYSVMINGVTDLIITKADVLSGLETIKVCHEYRINGKSTQELPFDPEHQVTPAYKMFRGWNEDLSKLRSWDQLPEALKEYIEYIESETGVPISLISVGPDRTDNIYRS